MASITEIQQKIVSLTCQIAPGAFSVLDELWQYYAEDVVYEDPMMRLVGREEVFGFYRAWAANTKELKIEVRNARGDDTCLLWSSDTTVRWSRFPFMTFCSPSVAEQEMRDGLVVFERNYFDLSQVACSAFRGGLAVPRMLVKPWLHFVAPRSKKAFRSPERLLPARSSTSHACLPIAGGGPKESQDP